MRQEPSITYEEDLAGTPNNQSHVVDSIFLISYFPTSSTVATFQVS